VAYPCVFCGQLKASKEHVYPKWLRSLQAPYDGVISVVETPQGNQVRPTQVPFGITVNTVCRDCNTGWMHDLEEATRPLLTRMIRGQLCELTLTDQHLLAQWVYKTVLMIHEQSRAASLVPPGALQVIVQGQGATSWHSDLAGHTNSTGRRTGEQRRVQHD